MGAIPTQRETAPCACGAPAPGHTTAHGGAESCAQTCTTLPGSPLAPGSARDLVRAAAAEWTEARLPGADLLTDRLVDDAVLVVSELVTNAVVHAGTEVVLECRLEHDSGALVVE